jgi:hypothetical protein
VTVEDIKNLVLSADPTAKHYVADKKGDAFTIWAETQRLATAADDRHDMGWAFQIVHYLKGEDRTTADAIEKALIDHPGVAYRYYVSFERSSGYTRHIFECEGQ